MVRKIDVSRGEIFLRRCFNLHRYDQNHTLHFQNTQRKKMKQKLTLIIRLPSIPATAIQQLLLRFVSIDLRAAWLAIFSLDTQSL